MEELSPGNAGVDEIETASITSTIETEIDSEEEWTVSSVLAEHEDGGKVYYLIRWEGYELFDASWEPEENLSASLLTHWQETKQQDDHERKSDRNIGAWRKASIERFRSKLARHEERNRKRLERGLEPTVYPTTFEEHIEALNLWPIGEDPDDTSTPSSPEQKVDIKTDDQPPPSPPELDQTVTTAQPDKDDADDSPKRGRRKRTAPAREKSPEQIEPVSPPATKKDTPRRASGDGLRRPDGPRRQVARPSSGLTSKFGRPNPPRRTSSETNGKEVVVRKAQAPDAFTGNVFSGGKVRKQRSTLADAVEDPTKQPKMLKHRFTRILEKRSRDKDGVVAPPKPAVLFSLNPREKRRSAQKPPVNDSNSDAAEAVEANSVAHNDGSVRREGDSPASEQEPTKSKKKKKSISWGQVEETTITPVEDLMDIAEEDGNLFFPEPPSTSRVTKIEEPEMSSVALPPSPPARRVRWAEESPVTSNNAHQALYTISKDVQFGPRASESISVTFKGPQPKPGQTWPSVLENQSKLAFTHSCMLKDFQDCITSISTVEPVSGVVSANDDPSSLASICSWLRVRSMAILFQHPDLCILLHAPEDGQTLPSNHTAPELKYILFRSAPQWLTSLAPISIPGEITSSDVLPRIGATVMHRLFNFHYERLLPENALNKPTKHHFFLAFPPQADLEAMFLGRWLRSCNPDCRILTSVFPGHWLTFLKMEHGVVIIPEEAIWSVRLFPNLHFLLHSSPTNFQFWLFSKSTHPSAMFPSGGNATEIGDISLQPICPNRKAIMVTPSFMVSQPQQVWNFFKWFWKAWNRDNDAVRLVVCAGFDSWIRDLASEKAAKLTKLSRNLKQIPVNSKEGVDALNKTWSMVLALIDGASDEHPPFIFAPECIDGNDEQSLVNWFGWWSIMNMDRFRKFSVLGSSEPDGQRMSRYITRRKYLASTFANPDDVYSLLDRKDSVITAASTQPTTDQSRTHLQLIPGDDAHSFKTFLSKLDDKTKESGWSPHIIYRFPVSYWDSAMAFDFADYHNAFDPYGKCMRFIRDHILESAHRYHNTAMALFYTMDGTWDPKRDPRAIGKTRRPWIMVYRPVEPHRKPWKTAELLIWDPARKGSLADSDHGDIYEGDLIQAQRELINAVQTDLTPVLPLEKVWVAGLNSKPPGLTEPLDIALDQFKTFVDNLKVHIPAPHHTMPHRGWRLIKAGDAPVGARTLSPEPMDIDEREESVEEDPEDGLLTVFHPPRGKPMNRPTNCKNRLYQHTIREGERSTKQERIEFKFRPTMEWYHQQVEEGRGFEQLQVTPWEAVFNKYKIDDPKKV
ncbi:hypothetical protein MRS44_010453 [Fusarium solani]|uniref:Chromo domain-containing protein n=1 Tax=Fusarium solani TaxID=169388 RepID=A0A9P9K3Q5_FUSSL|nr:uncharacterized protein B0J15DRAFT_499348 [Fusarium solani]KAH7248082.1 hypothetical protein B0J15DRAFT_499348 [Fusarium solani]KAJ3461900.1 hypothetical protein MRS44_010453 [Fusarium solani]